jgi:hypothetical protein
MRLLFCKNDSYTSRFLMWLFKEDCSHVAIDFENQVYVSGLEGLKKVNPWDFITRNRIVHEIDLKIPPRQVAELHSIYSHFDPPKETLLIALDLMLKSYNGNYLCTKIYKALPEWFVYTIIKKKTDGVVTASRLYKLILEHICKDTVKILKTI